MTGWRRSGGAQEPRGAGRARGPAALTAAALLAVVLAGCSSGSPTTTTTTSSPSTSTTGHSTSSAAVRALQQSLATVGCFSGSVDGISGPQTVTALKRFQQASGLKVDGIDGPNTEARLHAAVAAGTKVCGSSAPTTTTTVKPPTTTTSAGAMAPCTSAAVQAAVTDGTVSSFQCASGWASGSAHNPQFDFAFLLQSKNGVWVQPPDNACQNAAALGIPANILANSPCKVS